MTWCLPGSGSFRICGQVSMLITRADGLLSTAQAAQMVAVKPATIRKWVQRGRLSPRRFTAAGHPMYHEDDVARAEKLVHDNGLKWSGVDPRAVRHANQQRIAA